MDGETLSFIFSNVNRLNGFDVFLIFIIASTLSLIIFFIFKWLYSDILNNQKELIDGKDKLVQHYKQLYTEVSNARDAHDSSQKTGPSKLEENYRRSDENGGDASDKEYLLLHGAVIKIHSCYDIIDGMGILKNGLWAIVLKEDNTDYLNRARNYLYKIDSMSDELRVSVVRMVNGTDKNAFASKSEQYKELRFAFDFDLSPYKAILNDMEAFVRKVLVK